MSTIPPAVDDDTATEARARDADSTRLLLLQAARRRFALNGYAATTVREIAADAGVNVSLINRYYDSKEGLFEACLTRAAEDLDRAPSTTIDEMIASMTRRVAASTADDASLQLLLLLRSSGDERADLIRRDTIQSFARGIAGVAGWNADLPPDDEALLRAQIAICTALGIALLRSSKGLDLDPLVSATADQLAVPLHDLFTGLLGKQRP